MGIWGIAVVLVLAIGIISPSMAGFTSSIDADSSITANPVLPSAWADKNNNQDNNNQGNNNQGNNNQGEDDQGEDDDDQGEDED